MKLCLFVALFVFGFDGSRAAHLNFNFKNILYFILSNMVGQTVVANASMHSIWVLIDANQMHITEISDRLAKRYEESSARERSKKIDLEGGFGNKLWKANFKIDHENSSKDANSYSTFSDEAKSLKQEMHHIATSVGYTRIQSRKTLSFKTYGEPLKDIVYVSINVEHADGTIEPIANAYSIFCNQKLILGADLHIRIHDDNANSWFIDEYGKDHRDDWEKNSTLNPKAASKTGHAGHGFSVTPVMREDFGDHKKIDLFFRNEDIQEIGYFRFKMTFQPNQKIENKWNILNGPNANEYLLPDWVRLPPGETYKESGLVVNGPLPVTLGLEHRYC